MHWQNNTIWQWNCRGFLKKRAVLQTFLTNIDKPDVIALQECGKNAKLAGYTAYTGQGENRQTAILVKRNLAAVLHETDTNKIDHVLIELVPRKRKDRSLYVLNVYSSPKQKRIVASISSSKGPRPLQGTAHSHSRRL